MTPPLPPAPPPAPPPSTPDALRLYQAANRNHLGQPLEVDGILGPQTRWAMDLGTLCAARRILVREWQRWLNLVEVPPRSNDDPKGIIRGWLAHCHAKPGDPWCASYLSHCLRAIGIDVAISGALALGEHFTETLLPMAGDIFTYPTGGGHGHCGGLGGVTALQLLTFEGNCDNACRCVLRDRGVNPKMRFWRMIADTTGTRPGVVPGVPPAPGGTR